MSDLLVLRALLFVGECFLASLLLPLLGFAVTALLRRAALRHLAWTTLFGVLAVLPIVALLLPPRRIVEHVAAPVADAAPVALPTMAAPPPSLLDLLTPGNIVLALVALWVLGLAWQVLRLGVGMLGLMRLRRRSAAFAAQIETGCAVRLSQSEEGPSTFGILRPVILLPHSACAWPAARLEAVLRHEAAHVARRDTATQALARLVCAVFWLNPLLWLAYRALRREAEIAADDAVLASGMTPSLYAAELVGLAAQAQATSIPLGIAMARPPLVQRVQSVLAENSSRKGVTKMDMTRMGLLGLTAALLLGVARFDLAVAQDAPAPKLERNAAQDAEHVGTPGGPRTVASKPKQAANMDVEVEKSIQAKAAAVKAQAELMVSQSRAQAAAETDPKLKEIFRRDAEEKAAQAAVMKADAEVTATMSRARQTAAETRERLAADKARAEDMRQRADVLARRVGDPALSERERIAAAQDMADSALARTADAFARQAQMLKGSADAGKQQLNQLAADSVAVARQELAQARADAARPGHAESSASADSSVTIDGVNASGHVRLESKPGDPTRITADSMTGTLPGSRSANMGPALATTFDADKPDPLARARVQGLNADIAHADTKGVFKSNNVHIDAQVDTTITEAMNRPELRAAVQQAVTAALKEAGNKIDTAIAEAKAKAAAASKNP